MKEGRQGNQVASYSFLCFASIKEENGTAGKVEPAYSQPMAFGTC
jgi:hypothetical protein